MKRIILKSYESPVCQIVEVMAEGFIATSDYDDGGEDWTPGTGGGTIVTN